ncbi:ferripyoverdine receptor [Pseudomonas sp. PAGU 2196]|uniref:TonB-dependent siderophore receptor n=1 Tax=Pseudomonas sp. PAGU 2196 TaxID=2793997 RepID=UPI001EDDF99D|nr:TonB-dependent receptor [Pseudomonas sp. PAGU 2196]GHS84021.1 ferripyoverdine receptor [Pseudomonas sp. PAGU 2196]
MFVPPSRLACSIHRAALTLSLAGSLLVLPAAWAQAQRYDIPAGSLAEALSQFAAASGVMITFSAEDTAGLGSPGLQGDFELHQGFARLLQGSGLRLVQAGNKRYVLAKAERGAALELGATSINAASLGPTTEGTGSYTTGQSNTATKLPLTLRETPQSISVVTRQRMDDQGLNDITEVLQQTPGLSVQSLGSERFNIYSRGYSVDNYQFDGIPTTLDIATQMSAQSLADMAIYDRVEVLRGATGLMTGAGDPSATINLVRKRPTAEFKVHITAGVGSWDKYRSEVDLSGPLTPTGNVRGRMVAAYQQNNSFMDHYSQEKQIFYGVLEADLTDTTLLTVGADYQKNNPQGSSSVAFPLFHSNGEQTSFSRSTNSAARWSHNPQDALNTFASLEQKLAYDWTLKASVNQMYIKRDDYKLATASWGFPDESTGAGVRLYGGAGSTWQKQTGLDVQAQGPFQLFGRQHELIVGYNYSRYENRHTPTRGTRIEGTFVNVYDWDNYTDKPVMGGGKLYDGDTVIHQTGTYIATRLRPTDDLSVILGARVSKYDYDYDLTYPATPLSNRTTDYKESGVVTPYAGVVYDLNDIHSVYASWTSIYKPQSLRDADGSTLEPREGDNYEVGLKSEFFDGRLNTSIAAYEVKQDNLAVLDEGKTVNNDGLTAAYKAVSGATTRGFEVEANGELMPGWNVSASYNHGITKDRDGERLNTEAPANMVKLWSTYRLPGDFDRLTVGGGANWQSGTHITVTPSTALGTVKAKQSQFTVVNLMARYQLTDQLSTTLNINNLFDKKYISALDTTFYSGYYGEPRNVMLNTRYDF